MSTLIIYDKEKIEYKDGLYINQYNRETISSKTIYTIASDTNNMIAFLREHSVKIDESENNYRIDPEYSKSLKVGGSLHVIILKVAENNQNFTYTFFLEIDNKQLFQDKYLVKSTNG